MYSGRYLLYSRKFLTSMAVLMIWGVVKNSSRTGILEEDQGRTVTSSGKIPLLSLQLLKIRQYMYSKDSNFTSPKVLVMVAGAWLLLFMNVCMFSARVRYSFLLSVPGVVVSVPVGGCLMFWRVSGVVSWLLILVVVVVSSWRKVAWFTTIPLMVMYSGRYLWYSRKFLTSLAAWVMSCVVMVFLLVSVMGMLLHGLTAR